jgi:hypothetical protein
MLSVSASLALPTTPALIHVDTCGAVAVALRSEPDGDSTGQLRAFAVSLRDACSGLIPTTVRLPLTASLYVSSEEPLFGAGFSSRLVSA